MYGKSHSLPLHNVSDSRQHDCQSDVLSESNTWSSAVITVGASDEGWRAVAGRALDDVTSCCRFVKR